MKFVIDTDALERENLSLEEFAIVMYFYAIKKGDIDTPIVESLWQRGFLTKEVKGYSINPVGWSKISELVIDKNYMPEDSKIEALAETLMSLVPQTKMVGTPYYYKCNKREISNKLRKFYKIYGYYPDEDIINATKRYVASFNGDYRFMKLLKYFIYQGDANVMYANGSSKRVEENSQLATELENKDSTDFNNQSDTSWIEELR